MSKFIFSLLLAAAPAFAQGDYAELVDQAFEAIEQNVEAHWAYTESRLEEGTLWIGRYDPRRQDGNRWHLVTVDGREPTAEEIEEYLDEQDGSEDSDGNNTRTEVDRESLRLREKGYDYLLFDFEPADDDKGFMEHVDATLKIVTAPVPYVAFIDLRSRKPFKPATGVKLHEFATHIAFSPLHQHGPVLPRSVRVKVRGRAFLIISFDEATSIEYSDYEFVGGVDRIGKLGP